MDTLQKEKEFFITIELKLRSLVGSYSASVAIAEHKQVSSDYSTEVDIAAENLIVSEIKTLFPDDQILAEEGHSDTAIPSTRVWIIDPICGTNNLGRGINNFCTNIALSDNKTIIAACVIDYSHGDLLYSIGNNEVYCNNERAKPPEIDRGTTVDVDLGALPKVNQERKDKYVKFISNLLRDTDYMPVSLNTSLSFAYIAAGKIDGVVNANNHPWDICAASFLIQQSGGTITELNGSPWSITSVGAIAAKNAEVHQTLLDCYTRD